MSLLRCFLLWIGVTLGTLAREELKICDSTERQYHVAITDVHNNLMCGGSLISDSWILTDSYCYRWGMKIILGAHPGPGRTVLIDRPPVILKNQVGMPLFMLLKLPEPTKIEPVKLPTCPLAANADVVKIAGYGLETSDLTTGAVDSRESHKLQCVKINLSNIKKVERLFYFFFHNTDKRMDIPLKDAGGGVIYNNMIYGVMAFGIKPQLNNPFDYLELCPILNWITRIITT